MEEERSGSVRRTVQAGRSLIDSVLSWSIEDVLNKNLYKNQVTKIPKTFSTVSSYMNAFVPSLVEETREDLLSSIQSPSGLPICEILTVETSKDHNPPKDLFYEITYQKRRKRNGGHAYEPVVGDLIALTDVRPKYMDDLNRPQHPYLIAYVFGSKNASSDTLLILASKFIHTGGLGRKINSKKPTLFAVCLMNMTTNVRVWGALNSELGRNTKLFEKVLRAQPPNSLHGQNSCTLCSFEEKLCPSFSTRWTKMCSDLDDSQNAAVLNFIRMSKCHHQNTVKLIWGPPGTGKTKTVGLALFALFNLKCRTLTCAPTNIAVLQVTTRLLESVKQSLDYGKYGLGDIVLFGNRGRLMIDNCNNLLEVFLDHRAEILSECFAPFSGWKHWLESMIGLLEDPNRQYSLYLQTLLEKQASQYVERMQYKKGSEDVDNSSSDEDSGSEDVDNSSSDEDSNILTFKEFVKKKQELQSLKKTTKSCNGGGDSHIRNSSRNDDIVKITCEEFVKEKHNYIGEKLKLTMVNLYTHLPSSCISIKMVKNMVKATELIDLIKYSLCQGDGIESERLQIVLKDCICTLRSLRALSVPISNDEQTMRNLCLQNACLLFCTTSSSAKLHREGMKSVELLVIDEAAQLKECESAIPLQLPGLRHAMLVGDERQLPSMVKSKIAENAGFGRSLFERLVQLGCEKHLLNVQYRMHPTISFLPKKVFYNNLVSDGSNVKSQSYERSFLDGKMYGSYSFINIANGKEEFHRGCSLINMVEVAVVYQIVSDLYKEHIRTKKKVSVGIISPYKVQVNAIQERVKEFSKNYLAGGHFSVSVRSVDGFQGGEEDVIIISTVRCNWKGSIGFLSNHQRTNVLLTRARHCLWILGNEVTLSNSNSIWTKLINDAKSRNCFYNADEDNKLSHAMATALVELGCLLDSDSLLFRNSKWKVSFANEFNNSLAKIKDPEVRREVVLFLGRLSDGWTQSDKTRYHAGTSGQLLEKYKVNGQLNLIWTVDILQQTAQYVQIIKIWDLVQLSDVPKLAKRLDSIFESYTVEKMNRCKQRSVEGDIVVPIRWPVVHLSSSSESECLQFLSTPFSGLSLSDKPAESTATNDRYIPRHRRVADANRSRPRW